LWLWWRKGEDRKGKGREGKRREGIMVVAGSSK
jgi:hypothetical protein